MERDDEEQIDFSTQIAHIADRRYDDTGFAVVEFLEQRQTTIEVLVIAPYNQLVVGQQEDRPRSNRISDLITGLLDRVQDIGTLRDIKSKARRDAIAE